MIQSNLNSYQFTMRVLGLGLALTASIGTITSAPMAIASTSPQEALNNQECNAALGGLGRLLLSGRQLDVTGASYLPISNSYRAFPSDRPLELSITITGEDANAVMNSPQLLTTISRAFIAGCRPVGLVTFGVEYSGWINSFGVVNGSVAPFQCVDLGEQEPVWGYQYCD